MSSTALPVEGEKILIVDDDARLRRLLERFFDEQGYRVRAVENVEQMDRLLARELFNSGGARPDAAGRGWHVRLPPPARVKQSGADHHAHRQGR